MRKKLLAVIASAAMLVTMIPSMAFADTNVAKIGSNEYPTLQAAINAAGNGQTVRLLTSVSEDITVDNKNITLDLGNYTLSNTSSASNPVITNNGTLDISGGTISTTSDTHPAVLNEGHLRIGVTNVKTSIVSTGTVLENKGVAFISNAELTATGVANAVVASGSSTTNFKIWWPVVNGNVLANGDDAKINISDGQINGGIKADFNAQVNISGGMIKGKLTKDRSGNFEITGGKFYERPAKEYIANNKAVYVRPSPDSGFSYEYEIAVAGDDGAVEYGYRSRAFINDVTYYFRDKEFADEFLKKESLTAAVYTFAYDVNVYNVDPTGKGNINEKNRYVVPSGKSVADVLKANDIKLNEPKAYNGYRFIGWYEATLDGWEGEDGDQAQNLKYTKNKLDLTAEVTKDADYFAAWEPANEKPANAKSPNTGDDMNIALPVGMAIASLLAMAGLVFARRRHS